MKNIILHIKKLFILALLVGGISACVKDLGNYDYTDLQEIKIEGIDNAITALAYQNLSIPVELKGLQSNEERYSYSWEVIRLFPLEEPSDSEQELLATTKDFNEVIMLSPGPYKLIYTVTDKELGVFYQKQTDLSIITTTSEGWVVLCSEDGNSRLDMISNVLGEEIHFKDLLSEYNVPYEKGPISFISLSPENKDDMSAVLQVDPISPFYLLTQEGTTRLHKTGFKWEEEYLLKYEMGDMNNVKATHITAAGYHRAMVCDQGLFSSDYSMGPTLFGSKFNFTRDSDNKKEFINVAPYIGANITNPMQFVPIFMIYDLDNKRFAYHPTDGYLAFTGTTVPVGCLEMTDAEAGGDAFSFPVGADFVYMENSGRVASISMWGTPNNVTYTILEKDNDYHLYGIGLDDYYMALVGQVAYSKVSYANLANCTDIKKAKHFAFSPLNNQMFYAVDGKVYRVSFDTPNPSADFQFEIPGEVTCLKFYLYRNSENALRSYDLIVGSDKGGVDGGELRIYDAIDNLGQITEPKEHLSGFAKVVDVIYKEPTN